MSDAFDDVYAEMAKQLRKAGLAPWCSIKGCTRDEIEALEHHFNVKLPGAYRSYLRWFGKKAGELLVGMDCFYGDLWTLRGWAAALLVESGERFSLERDAFVFWMGQGVNFRYFLTTAGDDPPVFEYTERHGPPVQRWARFTESVREDVAIYIERLGR